MVRVMGKPHKITAKLPGNPKVLDPLLIGKSLAVCYTVLMTAYAP